MSSLVIRKAGIAALLVFAVFAVTSCGKKTEPPRPTQTRKLFGTQVTVTIYDPGHKAEDLKKTLDDVFEILADWDKRAFSPGPDNQVEGLIKGAGEQSVPVDAPVFDMLMRALRLFDRSGKVFDIRYGPMLDAWGFGTKPHIADQAALDTMKGLVADGGMFVAGQSILLAKKGMRFDVREFVEGYALDMGAARLAELGIRTAVLHTPRVWRMMGDAPDKRGFEVTLMNPALPDSQFATVWAPVGGVAFVNHGINRFNSGGKWYHSILDPRTGLPADKCAGAILQAADAATAQGLAYAAMVLGGTDGMDAGGKADASGCAVVMQNGSSYSISSKSGSLSDKIELRK